MRIKRNRKLMSILLTLSMLVTLLVPMVGPAAAVDTYTSLNAPAVDDNGARELGTVFAHFTAGQLVYGNTVTFRLPSDFVWMTDAGTTSDDVMTSWGYTPGSGTTDALYGTIAGNHIAVPAKVSGDTNGLYSTGTAPITLTMVSDKEVKLQITDSTWTSSGDDCWFYIYAKKVWVDDGYTGEIPVVLDAPSGSGFADGSVPVGTVSGGAVTVSVSSVDSFSDNDPSVKLRITEDRAGALEDKDETLKFKLPNGFVWSGTPTVDTIWGDATLESRLEDVTTTNGQITGINDDELVIDLPSNYATGSATSIEISVGITVDDETDAKTGDIMMKINGETDVTPSELKVGNYGTYETKIECKDTPTVLAGMLEQKIGNIVITESVSESLTDGRTLTLELPSNAKWGKMDDDSDSGLDVDITSFPGTDGKTAKLTFTASNGVGSTDAATLTLEDMEVVLEPGTTGDLKVKVGGTAGLTGELTVAKIVSPVTATASAAPDVKIGTVGEVGDFTITETEASAINEDKTMILDLPQGVRFVSAPKVEVIEGDLKIDADSVKTQKDGEEDDNQVAITIDSDSSTASKIKVSGIKYIVDRTVPEGDITLKVKGNAVADVNDATEVEDYYGTITSGVVNVDGKHAFDVATSGDDTKKVFPKTTTAAKAVNAKVVTPAAAGYNGTANFVIGQTTFKVNGVEKTMDVAPYLKSDRTYLPVRYVAQALGVDDSNIMWNDADQSVVIIKGDRVVKLNIGSTTMLINGVAFTMDVAPEIVDPGRTMLPLRWVAQALGADVQWDNATQTVTVTSK